VNELPTLPNRIRLSKAASDQLRLLKGRTGLTPNVLSRIAIIISIRAKHDPWQREVDTNGLEINLSTLLGEYAQLYELLLVSKSMAQTPQELTRALVSYVEGGLHSLRGVKNLHGLVAQIT